MNEFDSDQLVTVQQVAQRGAQRWSHNSTIVADAGKHAVDQFVTARLVGYPIEQVCAWAFRVGRNFAVKASKATRCRQLGDACFDLARPAPAARTIDLAAVLLQMCGSGVSLTRKQRQVLATIDPRQTIKGNAKSLGMTPHNLRRMLKTVGQRFTNAGLGVDSVGCVGVVRIDEARPRETTGR